MENTLRCLLERAVVRALIQELDRSGFVPHVVNDGGEWVGTRDEQSAIDACFAVDESWLYFRAKDDASAKPKTHGVFLVGGNGSDIISDYHCGNASFSAAVDRVSMNVEDLVQVSLRTFEPCPVASAEGAKCTRPAGHKHDTRAYNKEYHESGAPNYSRW